MDSRLILDAQAGYLRACVCVCVCVCVFRWVCVCVQMDLGSTWTQGCVCVCSQVGLGPTWTRMCVSLGGSGSNVDSRLTVDAQAGRLRAHASVKKPQVCALGAPARAQVCLRPSRAGGYRVPLCASVSHL